MNLKKAKSKKDTIYRKHNSKTWEIKGPQRLYPDRVIMLQVRLFCGKVLWYNSIKKTAAFENEAAV